MSLYKYAAYLEKNDSDSFDQTYSPGTVTPLSGIYRCQGCGREDVSGYNKPLPPQNHHQHTTAQGAIRWRLAVYADHKPKD